MGRIHAIEIHEQPWCPAALRDASTDYLQKATEFARFYSRIAKQKLLPALRRCGESEVLDLCSGAGGPWFSLHPELAAEIGQPLRVKLSDLHPNLGAFSRLRAASGSRERGSIEAIREPVRATKVPTELKGFRTMFAAFHHFRPEAARAILADAVRQRRGIAVFEPLERSAGSLVGILFAPVFCWLLTPWIRPFRWSRLVFTYLLPVIPLIILFDGVVSCLRVYSPEELRELVAGVEADYKWEIGRETGRGQPGGVTYLIGCPR